MTQTPIHPGEHLKEEMSELGMSAAELARKLDVPTNRITAILKGQRAITGDTALRLGPFLRHERGILAEPSKPLRASPGPAEGRESYRPPSDPQGIGTRPRMMAFRSIDRLPKHRADGNLRLLPTT